MRRINRSIKSGRSSALPERVWIEAHRLYPAAVARHSLYAAAFFGHSPPPDAVGTPDSVWRGCVRQALRDLSTPTASAPA